MIITAKILEALGLACVMIGLVQGIRLNDMWVELYLTLAGIAIFLFGWIIERITSRKTKSGPIQNVR
jgi:hypothetical protein